MHGFLIEDAKPVLSILQILFSKLGDIENDVFRERKKIEADRRHRESGRRSSPPVNLFFLFNRLDFESQRMHSRRFTDN